MASAVLVLALLAFGVLVAVNVMQVNAALADQRDALAADQDLTDARLAVVGEALAARSYTAEPSTTNLDRLRESVDVASTRLHGAVQARQVDAAAADRLLSEHRAFTDAAWAMVEHTLNGDTDARRVADQTVQPAYFVLRDDLERVAESLHLRAEQRIVDLQAVQRRTSVAQALGGSVVAVVVTSVLRMLLRYQRRIRVQSRQHAHEAMHDALTALPNRAGFSASLARVVDDVRQGATAAVALIDLDDFKTINDTFGHRAGDDVLVAVADVLRNCGREHDVVARLGGDEFAVILKGMPAGSGLDEWTRKATAALHFTLRLDRTEITVSGSVGASAVRRADDAAAVTHRADQAMYRAKAAAESRATAVDAVDTPQYAVRVADSLR